MVNPFISAIILAAGKSTRFPNGKLLQRIIVEGNEKYLLSYLVEKFIKINDISETIVVVGYGFKEIVEAIGSPEVKFVYNPMYRCGMSYSVKAGVRSVYKYSDIVVIHPGDVPFIKQSTIEMLINKAKNLYAKEQNYIIIPRYGSKGGHPLLISRDLLQGVLEITEEERGLKGFLRKYSSYKIYVETTDLGILYDIDTPDDLARAEKLFNIKWIRNSF